MPDVLRYFLVGIVLCLIVTLHVAMHIYAPRLLRRYQAWLHRVSKGRLGYDSTPSRH